MSHAIERRSVPLDVVRGAGHASFPAERDRDQKE